MIKKKLTGLLLAGGKSERFGQDKAQALYQGRSFCEILIDLLRCYCHKIILSTNQLSFEGIQIIPDSPLYKGKGPLGGLASVFSQTQDSYYLVLACDMPFLGKKGLDTLIHKKKKGDLLLCFKDQERLHPFPGIYHHDLLGPILQQLKTGSYQMGKLINGIEKKSILTYSQDLHKELANINSQSEYKKLIKHLS